ncbi:hypothetical protein [Winogradskyella aurantiaca]|uniref:hypothetical protein n=1 Tax=Winogradskyella aurantiaca TaxID=2219558 RepID=UPI000E1D4B0D|nr:hypothetical protein [Winogradskyella aurantiaca]
MNLTQKSYVLIIATIFFFNCEHKSSVTVETKDQSSFKTYEELVDLFKEWRVLETPPLLNGAPDYTAATYTKRWESFKKLQKRLQQADTTGWSIPQQVDYMIVWAEMNGYDFNHRILKSSARDPAFYKTVWTYKSDVPAHEGPTHHATLELWTYDFPLSTEERFRFVSDLKVIPALNTQAQQNLTGNARDLWIAGIRDIETQASVLKEVLAYPGVAEDPELVGLIETSISSTEDFASWLKTESENKTGPSGIGKDNYTWYLQNVHLVPLSWEDEVMLLKRELARAWSALKLEEHRNRHLPELVAVDSPEAYDAMADAAARSLMTFLEEQDILTVKPYFDPALREQLGSFIPEEERNFFRIGQHYDPRPLFSHFYHWFELARMEEEPNNSPIRRGPLLYNIFDSRNEGMATAVEEMFLQAGLYDDSPRSKEIVYIMIAQRAARGLGSLYAHANEMTMEEAGGIHSEYTPRGWMKTEKELLIFEQHLYLRQPGYGTSYITGKYLLEATMADFAKQKETMNSPFTTKAFFDSLNNIGNIPISLGHWELTGSKDHLRTILND